MAIALTGCQNNSTPIEEKTIKETLQHAASIETLPIARMDGHDYLIIATPVEGRENCTGITRILLDKDFGEAEIRRPIIPLYALARVTNLRSQQPYTTICGQKLPLTFLKLAPQ